MPYILYHLGQTIEEFDAPVVIDEERIAQVSTHQISTTNSGGTAGTLAVEVRPIGTSRWEALTNGGSPVVMSLTADVTFGPFDAAFDAIRFTPSGFDGASFTINLAGW